MLHRSLAIVPVLLAVSLLPGCKGSEGGRGGGDLKAIREAGPQQIEVSGAGGDLIFKLEKSDKGYEVAGPKGALATVKVQKDRVKLADAAGTPAFKIKQKEGGFKLYKEPAQEGGADVELANFYSDAGEISIKDGSDKPLFEGKTSGDKTTVTGPGGKKFVIKVKDDGVEAEDGAGKRIVQIKGLKSRAAALFCAASEYDALQKATVVSYVARGGE